MVGTKEHGLNSWRSSGHYTVPSCPRGAGARSWRDRGRFLGACHLMHRPDRLGEELLAGQRLPCTADMVAQGSIRAEKALKRATA